MSTTALLAIALAAIFATNLLPAFGPPTWALLVFFTFNGDLPLAPMIIGGAIASSSGRYVLGRTTNRFRHRFSQERIDSLEEAKRVLTHHRASAAGGFALFVLSPLPSAQMFVAAGLLSVPLLPLTLAFLAGRLVSYTVYLGGATLAYDNLGDTLTSSFTSTEGILVQVALVVAVVALFELDWAKWITSPPWRRGGGSQAPENDDGRPEGRPPGPSA